MSAGWWWASTGVLAVDGSAAAGQSPSIEHSEDGRRRDGRREDGSMRGERIGGGRRESMGGGNMGGGRAEE